MQPTATTIDHRHRIKRVMLYVDRHLDRPCRLADLAGVACYSPFHFSVLPARHAATVRLMDETRNLGPGVVNCRKYWREFFS